MTGASGFVGSAVARKLLRAGLFRARAGAPDAARALTWRASTSSYAAGDLRDAGLAGTGHAGVRYLSSTSPPITACGRAIRNEIHANNVARHPQHDGGGAARRRRAHRLHQQRRDACAARGRQAGRRNRAARRSRAIGAYKRSKVAAERLVERMVARDRLPAVIVNPSTPIGPRDVKPTPTGRIIVEAARGRMPAFVDTGLNFVHVDDVADGHLAALRKRPDRRALYPRRRKRAARADAGRRRDNVGRKPPRHAVPRHADHAARLCRRDASPRFTGREPFVTMDGLRMAKYRMFFTRRKSRARTRLSRAALSRRRSPMRLNGSATPDTSR